MVGHFVQDDALHLTAQQLGIGPVKAFERPLVDRDLVRERARVAARPARERDALVETEQRLAWRRLVLHDDLDVRELPAQVGRERVESVLDEALEAGF